MVYFSVLCFFLFVVLLFFFFCFLFLGLLPFFFGLLVTRSYFSAKAPSSTLRYLRWVRCPSLPPPPLLLVSFRLRNELRTFEVNDTDLNKVANEYNLKAQSADDFRKLMLIGESSVLKNSMTEIPNVKKIKGKTQKKSQERIV